MDHDKFLQSVSNKIKQLKEQTGVSFSELEARSGIDKGSLFKICSGKTNFTIKTLNKIAKAFEVDPKDLLP